MHKFRAKYAVWFVKMVYEEVENFSVEKSKFFLWKKIWLHKDFWLKMGVCVALCGALYALCHSGSDIIPLKNKRRTEPLQLVTAHPDFIYIFGFDCLQIITSTIIWLIYELCALVRAILSGCMLHMCQRSAACRRIIFYSLLVVFSVCVLIRFNLLVFPYWLDFVQLCTPGQA